jgi:hypothetical protein
MLIRARIIPALIAACLNVCFLAAPALAQSGSVNWGPWKLGWEVDDANTAGLGLVNVRFNDRLILNRANMPVVRVRYNGDACGPFADRITSAYLRPINADDQECGHCGCNQKVCQLTFSFEGRDWLEISVRALIGQYDMFQIWFLSSEGHFQARLFARGLQCQIDHGHHAYWRFDFDLDGSEGDEAFLHQAGFPDVGYGPGWFRYSNEFDSRWNPAEEPRWFARDAQTLLGAAVDPGSLDEPRDAFSDKNAGIRRYHGAELGPWQFGPWGHLGFNDGENVISQDNVLWYIGHFYHLAAEGEEHWDVVGPRGRVSQP